MKKAIKFVASSLLLGMAFCGASYLVGFQMARGRADAEAGYTLCNGPHKKFYKNVARMYLGL